MKVYDVCIAECEKRGISISELCRMTGISRSTFDHWRTEDVTVPRMCNLKALSKALQLPVVSILYPEINIGDDFYRKDGEPVTGLVDKLRILMAVHELDVTGFAAFCSMDQRAVYRWISGELTVSTAKCVIIANRLGIPLYVLLDSSVPLQTTNYEESEVSACSLENLTYSTRAIVGMYNGSKHKFCIEKGIYPFTLDRVLDGGAIQLATIGKLAASLSVPVKDLVTDYTQTEVVHRAFEKMSTIGRMRYMMCLKGVTPKYIVKTLSFKDEHTFSLTNDKMPREIPYIMAQYFQCPNAWFTKGQITLEPGQSLLTDWNKII